MDLSKLIGGGKYLKRLNQAEAKTVWSGTTLPSGVWVEALALTGKHQIDMLAVGGTNSSTCHLKYEIDGVESTERVISSQLMMLVIGLGTSNYTNTNILIDEPQYCKNTFKVFVKRSASASYGMSFEARYSQVIVEDME